MCIRDSQEIGLIKDTVRIDLEEYLCTGDTLNWNGNLITESTTICDTTNYQANCDTITCLNVSVSDTIYYFEDRTLCNGDSLFLGTDTIVTNGTYCETFTSISGCDSLSCLNVEFLIFNTVTIDSILCANSFFELGNVTFNSDTLICCLLYTSPSPRDRTRSRMPSSA